jgi:excisionase family DNA binding protein
VTAIAPAPAEGLVSLERVAEHLDVPVETVKTWRKRRIGPQGFRVGKHLRFRLSEVDAWLETRREAS